MPKGPGFTEQDLINKGFVKNAEGVYQKVSARDGLGTRKAQYVQPRITNVPYDDRMEKTDYGFYFSIKELAPGLNDKNGLLREHWRKRKKRKEVWINRIDALIPREIREHLPIKVPVEVVYTRHCTKFMDWDNACASFKLIGDALVHAGILSDDSPEIINKFTPTQEKCNKRDQQRTTIHIRIL